jgi:hypothetical protein
MSKIDYSKLKGCCSNCEVTGMDIVINGYCHSDKEGNGLCLDCYEQFKLKDNARKFRMEWLDHPRNPEIDIYE